MVQGFRSLFVPLQVSDDFFFLVQHFVEALNIVAVIMLALVLALALFAVAINIRLIFCQVFRIFSCERQEKLMKFGLLKIV